jgi:hypothetical protein
VCIVATARTVVLLLSAALAGCATAPTPQWLDARALCRQQWEATSNPPANDRQRRLHVGSHTICVVTTAEFLVGRSTPHDLPSP